MSRLMREIHDDITAALTARGLNPSTFKLKLNSKSDDYEARIVISSWLDGRLGVPHLDSETGAHGMYPPITLLEAFGRTAEEAMEELLTLIKEG